MDGVPGFTQRPVMPGEAFTYEFVAVNPGTHSYHCHVQPDVHVLMGLMGMLVIERDRPGNHFSHLVIGAGEMPELGVATAAAYDREYSLVYMDMDDRLNRVPLSERDPRTISRRMHREYDSTQRRPGIFMLNGRSFPFTLRDTPVRVAPGERVKLRVLNAGARTVHLHTHGHRGRVTHRDGNPLPAGAQYLRDVFSLGAAQRLDIELRPGADETYSSGPGVWLMHDHTEHAVTNKGIHPGGDLTVLVYPGFLDASGLPKMAAGSLERFFDPRYHQGLLPVFDDAVFLEPQTQRSAGRPGSSASAGMVWGHGKVIAVQPAKAQIVIRHGPIHGVMPGRITTFRAATPSLLEPLRAGQEIRFAIDGTELNLVQIRPIAE